MFQKMKAVLVLLKVGRVVIDPAKWKRRQISASILITAIWALADTARAFGYEIPVDGETVDALAVGLLAVVNWVLTLTTTDKLGLPTRAKADA
ncbi:hypothetical protein [Kineobactrum salinum]|uniref:Phage holin n=1 Tax=Kineobactrum salinum TaxID=2708301 RepID=A0A6C0U505_9GAMM|nr:hypothetical protein [Kineobactrum salinum]QIB67191.1 hypothetical protein G3T16_19045 [Kineobactrum salinum]